MTSPVAVGETSARPAVVLTFLAPAAQCNQHCPQCIIDLAGEPVRDFALEPQDYSRFVEGFVAAGLPVRAVTFQGFEVTLPASWKYLEAVFAVAVRHRIRRSFITNGMLLHKWVERIRALDPHRITVSVDGATPEVNDPIRGLDGAFVATMGSVGKTLAQAPELAARFAVASTLYGDENYESLLSMPTVVGALGIPHWMVSAAATYEGGRHRIAASQEETLERFQRLEQAAVAAGLRFHVNDELGQFRSSVRGSAIKRVPEPLRLLRLDPSGGIRAGEDILDAWDENQVRRWDPRKDDPVDVALATFR